MCIIIIIPALHSYFQGGFIGYAIQIEQFLDQESIQSSFAKTDCPYRIDIHIL